MNARRFFLAALCSSALLLHGCAQSSVRTTLHRDGSWTREDSFAQTSVDFGDQPGAGLDDLRHAFDLPSGRGWKVRRGGEKSRPELRASRSLRAGQGLKRDIVVKSKRGRLLWNEVSVRQIRPGVWQYREVLHWAGKPLKQSDLMASQSTSLAREFQRALPPRLSTPGNASDLSRSTTRAFAMLVLGPPRPLLPEAIPFTELALQQLMLRLGQQIDRALKAKFGAQITNSERYLTTRQVTLAMTEDWRRESEAAFGSAGSGKKPAGKKPGRSKLWRPGAGGTEPPREQGDFSNVSMTFSLRVPGRVLETNGELNPYTGEIFWGLYPEASQLGDVVLSATTEMKS